MSRVSFQLPSSSIPVINWLHPQDLTFDKYQLTCFFALPSVDCLFLLFRNLSITMDKVAFIFPWLRILYSMMWILWIVLMMWRCFQFPIKQFQFPRGIHSWRVILQLPVTIWMVLMWSSHYLGEYLLQRLIQFFQPLVLLLECLIHGNLNLCLDFSVCSAQTCINFFTPIHVILKQQCETICTFCSTYHLLCWHCQCLWRYLCWEGTFLCLSCSTHPPSMINFF